MALWFNLRINRAGIGMVEIRRRDQLVLADRAAIQNAVSTYDVFRDDERIGSVSHRYGDGAWKLLALAADLLAKDDEARPRCQEPTCPDFGDPDFGEGTCPAEHAEVTARAAARRMRPRLARPDPRRGRDPTRRRTQGDPVTRSFDPAAAQATPADQPKLTPEAAAEIVAALKRGDAIVCYSKCWPCQFGQCDNEPHTWMDDDDREHAGIPASTTMAELAIQQPCGCRCNGGPK